MLSHRIITTETSSAVTKREISNMRINCRITRNVYLGYYKIYIHTNYLQKYSSKQIKSNHFYCHITCALVIEILESMLQTVQKQFTYRQYILTQKIMCRIHIHILRTHSVLFKTYLQLSIHVMHRMYTFYIMYTYIHTIVCGKKGATDYT